MTDPPPAPPPVPGTVADGLARWLTDRYGAPVGAVGDPERLAGGFDFWIYALRFAGDGIPEQWKMSLVARIPPEPERGLFLETESRLQSWAAAQEFPAPRVLELIPAGAVLASPIQVVTRVPGRTMTEAMTSSPSSVPRLIKTLGSLHARLHSLPPPDDSGDPEAELATRRLHLVRHVLSLVPDQELATALDQVEAILPRLVVEDPVLCHGDFHPMNVLVAETRARSSIGPMPGSAIGMGTSPEPPGCSAWPLWVPPAPASGPG